MVEQLCFLVLAVLNCDPNMAPARKSDAKAIEVIMRSVAALGGKDRIVLLTKSYKHTKANAGGDIVDLEEWIDGAERHKRVIRAQSGDKTMRIVRVIDGNTVWQRKNDEQLIRQDLQSGSEAGLLLVVRWLIPLLDPDYYTLQYIGEVKIGDQDTHRLRGMSKGYPSFDMFFDKKSSLLVKYSYKGTTKLARGKTIEHFFTEYRDFDGMKYAAKTTMLVDGALFSQDELIELRLLKQFPKGTFDKP